MDKIIEINGIALPAPVQYDVEIIDLSKSTQNTYGDLYIEVVNTKRKIYLDITMLSSDEQSQVLKLISKSPFSVKYQDPQDGIKTGEFYTGNRKSVGWMFIKGKMEWKGLAFNLIET